MAQRFFFNPMLLYVTKKLNGILRNFNLLSKVKLRQMHMIHMYLHHHYHSWWKRKKRNKGMVCGKLVKFTILSVSLKYPTFPLTLARGNWVRLVELLDVLTPQGANWLRCDGKLCRVFNVQISLIKAIAKGKWTDFTPLVKWYNNRPLM